VTWWPPASTKGWGGEPRRHDEANGEAARGARTLTSRSDLPETAYAFRARRNQPLTDGTHVRNALARFDQVKGVSDADQDQAWSNILAAAKHYDVDVAETD
jgi:hypothetical protein